MRMRTVLVAALLVPAFALAQPKKQPKPKPKTPPAAPPAKAKVDPKKESKSEDTEDKDKDKDKEKDKEAPKDAKSDKDKTGGGGGTGGGGSGGGGGDGKEPKDPPKDAGNGEPKPDPKGGETDVDTLRQEYLTLRDELFKSRARANAVATQLYSTRIQIKLTYTTARYYNPAKATIRLDGAGVYENAAGAIATDDGIRFEGFIAPGRHTVTFRVEATGKDDDTFTSVTETQIVVKAVAGKDLVVSARAKDSGDIAYEWKKKERGSYGLAIDTAVKTVARPTEGAPAKGKK